MSRPPSGRAPTEGSSPITGSPAKIKIIIPSLINHYETQKQLRKATKGPDDVAGTDDDADVISMSLGGPHSSVLYDAVKYAYNYNVTLVAAAGNDGASQSSCPACYREVIAVGAVDSNYNVPGWSNRNPDVVAPGVNILST